MLSGAKGETLTTEDWNDLPTLTTEDWNDLRFALVPLGRNITERLLGKVAALLAERERLIQELNSWKATAEELGDRVGLADLLGATDD